MPSCGCLPLSLRRERPAPLCGVEVQEYDSLLVGDRIKLKFVTDAFSGAGQAAIWCDILKPTTAVRWH